MIAKLDYKMEVKRIQNGMIRGAHKHGNSAYLVHRALKENRISVYLAIQDFYDSWMPGVCSYSILYAEGFKQEYLNPCNYPEILAGIKREADKAELNQMVWP